jgi:hypothetical protein
MILSEGNDMGMLIPAKMKDGTPITLRFEDKAESVPGFKSDGSRFDAYTSWFRAEAPGLGLPYEGRVSYPEVYSQVSIAEAKASGDELAFRTQQDDLCLDSIGVDVGSLDLDHIANYDDRRHTVIA